MILVAIDEATAARVILENLARMRAVYPLIMAGMADPTVPSLRIWWGVMYEAYLQIEELIRVRSAPKK
jgi:hypothetical protein